MGGGALAAVDALLAPVRCPNVPWYRDILYRYSQDIWQGPSEFSFSDHLCLWRWSSARSDPRTTRTQLMPFYRMLCSDVEGGVAQDYRTLSVTHLTSMQESRPCHPHLAARAQIQSDTFTLVHAYILHDACLVPQRSSGTIFAVTCTHALQRTPESNAMMIHVGNL